MDATARPVSPPRLTRFLRLLRSAPLTARNSAWWSRWPMRWWPSSPP
jgi:hypothetical protein